MNNNDERNLTLIESAKTEVSVEKPVKTSKQTNPIAKKFLEFHNSKAEKFKVKDLFKTPSVPD